MAIITTDKITVGDVQNRGIAINQGSSNKFTGVFANIGNLSNLFENIVVGGGGGGGGGATGGTGTIVIAGAGDDGSDVIAFDPMLDEVRPGDLITSDFMKRLLQRINVLEAAVLKLASGGEVVVPDLFGQQLSAVRTAVNQSGGKLKFGLVLDAFQTEIDPDETDEGPRLVLGQYPVPGAEVDEGTELNLFVSTTVGFNRTDAGFDFALANPSAASAAPAPAAEELQRVTDETPTPAAGGASKGASKARKGPAK